MNKKVFYDLHMHSCLSPCGEMEMTPNNIVGMATIKELSLIAVADHNCARNMPAIAKVAEAMGVLLLPAIEITTAEEVHLLSYFPTVEQAVDFGEYVYAALPDIKNRPEIFGEQCIMNEDDEQIGTVEKLLINACAYSIDQLVVDIRAAGGVPVPAHVNKTANSLIENLGFIPPDLNFKTIEVGARHSLSGIDIDKYRILTSSDAHQLIDMAEPEQTIGLSEMTAAAVIEKLRAGRG